ncbi:MAG: hypothetical protein PF574_04335 [Candidatus Delongbacteria bacterium]|jgi:autotransporter family porin|nr:hypothetical protein [Candidatus Delongbacteria bacterium]
MKTIVIMLTICVSIVSAAVNYVDVNSNGLNDGSSWVNAYTDLQTALETSTAGDEIWMAAGTYYPSVEIEGTGDRFKAFHTVNGVAVYGGFAGNETAVEQRTDYGDGGANETILSGDIGIPGDNSDNCYHVINNFDPGSGNLSADATTILDGLTIAYGNANGADYIDMCGGGMLNHRGNPTLRNLVFKLNSAVYYGSALHCYVSSSKLDNSQFIQNTTTTYDATLYTNYCDGMVISDCDFLSNVSARYGGAVTNYYSSPTYNNTTFISNYAMGGGALYSNNANPVFNNALFYDNEAYYSTTMEGYGGAIRSYSSNPTFNNATIVNNTASNTGGGIYGDCTLNNCIIWGNTAVGQGDQIYSTGTITMNNCCYSNETGDVQGYGTTTPNNCITTDPQLLDPSNNDYHISGDSPCINMGNNSYNTQPYDLQGEIRIQDLIIDIGAYEWTFLAPENILITRNTDSTLLDWTAASEAISYKIYRSDDPNGIFNLIDTVTATTYTDNEVLSGNKYFYYVIAVNE